MASARQNRMIRGRSLWKPRISLKRTSSRWVSLRRRRETMFSNTEVSTVNWELHLYLLYTASLLLFESRSNRAASLFFAAMQKEQDAFCAFLATFELEHPIHSLSDLRDGTTLFEFPQIVYAAPSLSLSYCHLCLTASLQRCRILPSAVPGGVAHSRQLGSAILVPQAAIPTCDTVPLRYPSSVDQVTRGPRPPSNGSRS